MRDFSGFSWRCRSLASILLALTLVSPVLAQQTDDPPARIGRIAWISGDVFLNNPETGELGVAPLNQPLTSGDVITTQPESRAEIQIGAMTLRLNADTRVQFDRIDDEQIHVVLNGGQVIAKLPTEDTRSDFILETREGRFIPLDTGIYRVDHSGGDTTATAYFGTLRFDGQDLAFDIVAGESARLWMEHTELRYHTAQGVRDEFTQWSTARDQQQRTSVSSTYVSPEMTGAQDLDAYGDWSDEPEHGAVWYPRSVEADWAPYRVGQWSWVAPWGWTWIGHEPWGFAPFHYGRWVHVHNRWGWVPGTRIARPVYAPALVAWVGTAGVGVSVRSAPPSRWFPLAPREVYAPFYRSSPTYVRHINTPHVTNIRNINEIVARPREFVSQNQFSYRNDPRAFSTASANAPRQRQAGAGPVSGSASPRASSGSSQRTESRPVQPNRQASSNASRSGQQPLSASSGQRPQSTPAIQAPSRSEQPGQRVREARQNQERSTPANPQREARNSSAQGSPRVSVQESSRQPTTPRQTSRNEVRRESSAGQQGTSIRENPSNRNQEANRPEASSRNSRENTNTSRAARNERPAERAQPQPRNNVQPPQQRAQPSPQIREERRQRNEPQGSNQRDQRSSRQNRR